MIDLSILGVVVMTFDELVDAQRGIDGLRDTGKVHPNFEFRSKRSGRGIALLEATVTDR